MTGLDQRLDNYIEQHTSPESELLQELDRQTHLRVIQPRMISGHVQGQLLKMLVQMLRPQRILEIGTFTGYSALCMADGLDEQGRIHTVEIDDELESISSAFFARSRNAHKIVPHIGSALDVAPRLGETFDLVFIDGDKREYTQYYQMLMGGNGGNGGKALVRSGSILIADNILWYGKVVEDIPANDAFTRDIVAFNRMVQEDPRVENVILPLRDGLSLIRVK